MRSPRASNTRERIRATALALFAEKGVQNTSLREIAEHLGITKPALYYHFRSREELVASLVQPLLDDAEAMLTDEEARARTEGIQPRRLLERYFDLWTRHREVSLFLVRDLSALGALDLTQRITDWRLRMLRLLTGPEPTLAEQTRAITAVGGLADCTVVFGRLPPEELRPAAVDAACAALGLPPA